MSSLRRRALDADKMFAALDSDVRWTNSRRGRTPLVLPRLTQPLRASGGFTDRFSSQYLMNAVLSASLSVSPSSVRVSGKPVTTTFCLRLVMYAR